MISQGAAIGGDEVEFPRDVERRPLASRGIYGSLRRRIVDLRLKPGALLSRAQLAEEYGVSQTPVRDAFFQLQREGLVEIFPQSRSLVAKINVDHARETQFLRIALEVEVVKCLAIQADAGITAPARRIVQAQMVAVDEDDLERFSILDQQFHYALCDAAGYPRLLRVIAERSGHIDRLRRLSLPDPGKITTILTCHDAILTAIEAADVAAAEDAVRRHLSGTLSALPSIMQRYAEFMEVPAKG
ncbi:GntR family transcriptional regulator [Jiella sp. MQZ9-1]|uniref:GntR family transcriptional regulator n=1 Tax=Jiella flava TaxID=2816857 RepID=A0A939FY35_9HYPH|nr:GntR family transcriptional regulator [Jiella flava]MBO0663597.1 GntR family transcriptional regulator [Jiella flava]MCD2472172.1 GntR family transcriptional regulator [Jiella flava]